MSAIGRNEPYSQLLQGVVAGMYEIGISCTDIGRQLNMSHTTVLKYVRQHGIEVRPANSKRKVEIDDHFFDVIDTEEKAYWLGFITADGNVSGNRIGIGLQARDKEHLLKWLKTIGAHWGYCLVESMRGKSHQFSVKINSPQMVSALSVLGVFENKSHNVHPATVRCDLQRHYWRGVFDGDGFIRKQLNRSGKRYSFCAGLAGNAHIITAFAEFMRERTPHKMSIHKDTRSITSCTTEFGGVSMMQRSMPVLYANANVFLDRKKAIYDELMATPVLKKRRYA